jgi:hypothetical protein
MLGTQKVNDNGSITVPLLVGAPLPRAQWLTRAGFMYDVRVFYLGQPLKASPAALFAAFGSSKQAAASHTLGCLLDTVAVAKRVNVTACAGSCAHLSLLAAAELSSAGTVLCSAGGER